MLKPISILFIAILVGAVITCAVKRRTTQNTATTVVAKRMDISNSIELDGEIRPKVRVNIGPPISGQITEILVGIGQSVAFGDTLAIIDNERYKQEELSATLALASLKEEQRFARLVAEKHEYAHTRYLRLFEAGLVSKIELDNYRLIYESAQATVSKLSIQYRQLESYLAIAKDNTSKSVIKSPITGVISAINVERGEMAQANQYNASNNTIMTIVRPDKLLAESKITETLANALVVGDKCDIIPSTMSGLVYTGKVIEISPATKQDQGSSLQYIIKCDLDLHESSVAPTRSTMSATIIFNKILKRNVIAVPTRAIKYHDRKGDKAGTGGPYVVVISNGRTYNQSIALGAVTSKYSEVIHGLREGEIVIY